MNAIGSETYFALRLHCLCHDSFRQLDHIRTLARSLSTVTGAATTLVHTFVTARLDYNCRLFILAYRIDG